MMSAAAILEKPLPQRRKWEQARYDRIYQGQLDHRVDTMNEKFRLGYGASNHGHHAIPLIRQLAVQSLVDVGTGKGKFVQEAYVAGVQQVYGYDFVIPTDTFKAQLGEDGAANGRKLVLGQAFAHALPIPDKSVEAVTSFDVLEHLWEDELPEVFQEWLRVATKYWIVSVSHIPSSFSVCGANLHRTVKPPEWWRTKLSLATGREVRLYRNGSCLGPPSYMWIAL
jgi:ubiquinone/menaquinone biosynthesis C-methylase UbiE